MLFMSQLFNMRLLITLINDVMLVDILFSLAAPYTAYSSEDRGRRL